MGQLDYTKTLQLNKKKELISMLIQDSFTIIMSNE